MSFVLCRARTIGCMYTLLKKYFITDELKYEAVIE